jgi:acyl-CoA synthetase (AMP-forming)/AMP-acid ligase II
MLLLPNSIAFVVVLLATQFAGLRCALANPGYMAKELKHVHDLVQPRKIFTTTTLMKNLMRSGLSWNKAVTVDQSIGRGGARFLKDLMVSEEQAKQAEPFIPQSFN